jgi:outer membrane protein assembly factor BamE (lipoprotein component of BamABCDE complex)
MKYIFLLLSACFALSACTPTVANRGNLVETYQLQEVIPGQDSRDDVTRKIGSPTTIAPFDTNTWYYMGQRTSKKAMLDPKITRERIIVVTFANDGYVDKIVERRDGRQEIPIVSRKTPTTGNEFTFMQQMLGNLGRFNSAKGSAATTATGGGINR